MPGVHTRLLGEQGGVLVSLPFPSGAAPVPVPSIENTTNVSPAELAARVEIQSALAGAPATAVRRVASANNRRVLYAAVPVLDDAGANIGIIYLATPLPPSLLPTKILLQLAGALVVAIALAGAVGMLLARRITRPMQRLAAAANHVAGGDLAQAVPVDTRIRELHQLGLAFNRMTANLRHSDQAKNAFLADVTHELRTPLTVIKGTIETLEDGALDDMEGRGPLLDAMQRETDRLIRLVNGLLVLTRADVGALNLRIERLDLAALARSRCAQLSILAHLRQVTLQVEAQGEAFACADADRAAQVVDNLVENAIRHAPENSTVTVVLQAESSRLLCQVQDEGSGIPAQHLPYIFDRFYRADPSRNRSTGGLGLGLAIVKALVEAQRGGVSADSVEGEGTTISFWLPADGNCHTMG